MEKHGLYDVVGAVPLLDDDRLIIGDKRVAGSGRYTVTRLYDHGGHGQGRYVETYTAALELYAGELGKEVHATVLMARTLEIIQAVATVVTSASENYTNACDLEEHDVRKKANELESAAMALVKTLQAAGVVKYLIPARDMEPLKLPVTNDQVNSFLDGLMAGGSTNMIDDGRN